jgi:hypothetical protein
MPLFQEYVRDMSDEERAELQGRIAAKASPSALAAAKQVALWAFGLVLCAVLGFAVVISGLPVIANGIFGGLLVVAAIVCLYAIIALIGAYIRERRMYLDVERDWVPAARKALAANKVSVKRVESSSVITIEPFDDEGEGYVFDIGDGRVVFLKGDEYFPVHDNMSWPNSEFEIVRCIDEAVWVGLFCYGQELIPARVIEEATYSDDVLWDNHEDIVEADMDDFVAQITKAS